MNDAQAEEIASFPDLSSLPNLPYDFRGPYKETHYLKERIVFQNVNGEYMAFDTEGRANVGVNLVWWNKWNPYGYHSILPNTPVVYANIVPSFGYSSYKYINGEWIYQDYINDNNSFDFYAEWVIKSGSEIRSTVNLLNLNGQIYDQRLHQWVDASFKDYMETMNGLEGYILSLPKGVSGDAVSGEAVFIKNDTSPDYICGDGIDNDDDGYMDIDDPSCHTDWDASNLSSYSPQLRSEENDNIKRVPLLPDGTEIDYGASQGSLSADGKILAFASISASLRGGHYNSIFRNNVYVYNSSNGEIKHISKSLDASEPLGSSDSPVISGDGRYVAFSSDVTKLVEDGIGGQVNVYLYDRNVDSLIMISRGLDGRPAGKSYSPSISQDGRYISFESDAENLIEDDYNGQKDIFIYEISTGEIVCASRNSDGVLGNNASQSSSLSADGRYVGFLSAANNLAADDTGYEMDVFVKDLETGEVELASLPLENGAWGWGQGAYSPSISPDGRYVSFYSSSPDFVYGDSNGRADVFIYDKNTHSLKIISTPSGEEQADGDSSLSFVSSNGHYVVFLSYTSNLTEKGKNGMANVFIRNQETGEIRILGEAANGLEGNGSSYPLVITPDGRYILITSNSSNLVAGDMNGSFDLFVVKNPFIEEYELPFPSDLSQKNHMGLDVKIGGIVNEGLSESANSLILSAYVPELGEETARLEIQLKKMDDLGNVLSIESIISSAFLSGDKFVSIEYAPAGGLYSWKARIIDELGRKSNWADFGNNEADETDFISSNFSFIHITDVHLGSNMALAAGMFGKDWYESQSYPRFTDILYEIEHLDSRPDFILVGGDNIEYNDERWLRDFKAITDDYSQRTGIKIYVVPGNHDRYDSESSAAEWGETDLSGGNDKLVNYFKVMGRPEGVVSLFENDWEMMNAEESQEGGLNRYNYYFYHKGLQFIGLDSGEDTGVWDIEPEGKGLSSEVVEELERLTDKYSDQSKIIFMHHPVYSEMNDPPYYPKYDFLGREIVIKKDQSKTDTGELAENGGIVNNWKKFLEYCKLKDVQLVLTGHNHGDFAFDSWGNRISKAAWEVNRTYPLYIQTQSSGKDDDRGYRIIKVINGKSIPQEPTIALKKYEKIFIDLDTERNLEWSVYDFNNRKITLENSSGGLFVAPASDRKILYEETNITRFEIKNSDVSAGKYDLRLQKRNEGGEPNIGIVYPLAYLISNNKHCSLINPLCLTGGIIYVQKNSDYVTLDFKDINIDGNATQRIFVDWGDLSDFDIKKVRFGIDGDFDSSFQCMGNLVTVDLNSPGELRVYDKEGNVTGLVDGKIKEEIPNSLYVPESETAFIFGDNKEIGEGLEVQVVGAYEATYDLAISLSRGEEQQRFFAENILTKRKSIHQFSVDWGILAEGENGVRIDFDEDGDGNFEYFIYSGEKLYAPRAILNSDDYESVEGGDVFFDASGSFDGDGAIVSFEWDFDGDGNYDAISQTSSIKHIYEDDFEGWMVVRIKDNDGLLGLAAANVSIKNFAPQVEISRLESIGTMENFVMQAKFFDSGKIDSHMASIDWGDGQIESVSIEYQSVPEGTYGKIVASHTYNQLQSYMIKLEVEDSDGARGEAFHVLKGPRQIRIDALSRLKAIKSEDKYIQKEIEKAAGWLEIYLDDKYWMDDFRLNPAYFKKFLNEEEKGIRRLEKIINKEKPLISPEEEEIQAILDLLLTFNQILF